VPRYYYRCESCGGEFEVRHGMTEAQNECLCCSMTGPLVRVPQLIQKTEVRQNMSTAKDNVINAIEENRETLNKMKTEGIPNDFN